MKGQKIWANFSVQDAGRTRQFYTQLGIQENKPNSNPKLASFLFGENDFVIHDGHQFNILLNEGM